MSTPDHNNKPDSLGTLLRANRSADGGALLLGRRGLEVPTAVERALRTMLEELVSGAEGPIVLTVLSNAEPELNPFAGLAMDGGLPSEDIPAAELVSLLAPGHVHAWHRWPRHAALLSESAVELLDRPDTTHANALQRLRSAGGQVLLADTLFLHDPSRGLFETDRLEPQEERRPAAWALSLIHISEPTRPTT